MRRSLVVLLAVVVSVLAPVTSDAFAATSPTEPPVTLADGKSLTECISALPKPGCTTRREADGHQLAVLGVMAVGIAFIGWRVTSGVRKGRRPAPTSVD